MENHLAIQEFNPQTVNEINLEGTKQLYEKAVAEIGSLVDNLTSILGNY
jgi:hypothetical protein